MITILAIGPAVIIPVLLVGGALAGLFALFRRKGAAPPDPGSIAAAPFLHMEAGTTTAHLERKGNLWQWSLSGGSTTASSDSDAGKAALAMAETLAATEEGAPITGSAGGPGVATLEFGVQPDIDDDGWDWTITEPSKLPNIGNKPAPPMMMATGSEQSRGGATVRMLAALSKAIPWLNVQDPGGGMVGTGAPKTLPGLVISGSTVAVTDLATWVAHAAPYMRDAIDEGLTADEIMDAAVADLPENATLSGKSIQDVRENVTKLLDMLATKHYVAVASPDEQLAAVIVGANLRPPTWTAMEYKGHVILTRPQKGGKPGTDWEWLVWEGGVRGYDSDAHAGSLGPNKTRAQNERFAKQQIDQAINAGGEWPGGGEAGGNQTGTVAPDYGGVAEGAFQAPPPKASEEAYMPAVKRITTGSTRWTGNPGQTEIEIFDFAKPAFAAWKHWRIGLGVCMRPTDTNVPFGVLSTILATNPAGTDAVKISNAHAQGGAIGPPPPVWWDNFTKPLLWKGQFDGWVHRGPVIGIDQFDDVTGTGAGEQLDPCDGDESHWPTPTNDELGFYVQPVGSTEFLPWRPAPEVKLITKGTKVLARITYRGFPVFATNKGGTAQAQLNSTTKFKLDVQIWAAGTNEAP